MSLHSKSIVFSYSSDEQLFAGLSLNLGSHRKVALAGPNGGGKTTLLRLLAGKIEPDSGSVAAVGEVLLLEQHISKIAAPFSGGEQRIAALRKAFASQAEVLLLDEPTNDLDENAREWLKYEIEQWPATLLMVSHDPMILDLVDEVWELNQGIVRKHPPGYQAFLERLTEEEARLKAEIDSLRAENKRVEARAREAVESQKKRMVQGDKAGKKANLPKIIRGGLKRKAQATMARVKGVHEDRAEASRERIAEVKGRLRSISMFEWDSSGTKPPAGKTLLKFSDARMPDFKRGLDFEMVGAKRVHLKGKNGSGKSTFLRALCREPGALKRSSGEFYLAKPFQLFDQSLSQFTAKGPLWEWFQQKTQLEISAARTIVGMLGFDQEEQLRPVFALSGGERVRLEIALALHAKAPPQILLLDEPTNHLDIESRRILQIFVEKFEGGIILVSHDKRFAGTLNFDEVIDLEGFRR